MKNKIELFDSVKRNKVEFIPIDNEVKIYVCGPTVYDNAHLGHARSSISFDLLRRVLLANRYKVTFARNYTDIDDKIINKMAQTGETLSEITNIYIKSYEYDMRTLNVLDPDIKPKATETINDIAQMVNELLIKNYAYRTSSGDVYFDTSRDSEYTSLSHRNQKDEERESRLTKNEEEKRNSSDFVLWKASQNGDLISFDSSIGSGRPGWHIECSAMINKHLAHQDKAYSIDIHCGGADLLFPHHENEASQSRCATGIELAKYWLHNGFVKINNEKMSKSLGNSFFIKDILQKYSGEVVRFYLLSTHYRSDFNFSEDDLIVSKRRLDKLYRLKKRVKLVSSNIDINIEFKDNLLNCLNDDLNISQTLAELDKFISEANDKLDKKIKDSTISNSIIFINDLLGVGGSNEVEYFKFGLSSDERIEIENLIANRIKAKQIKNFKLADEIRTELNSMNIVIMDSINGTEWERIE
jgi:cysteinyl-tRNA synthetase